MRGIKLQKCPFHGLTSVIKIVIKSFFIVFNIRLFSLAFIDCLSALLSATAYIVHYSSIYFLFDFIFLRLQLFLFFLPLFLRLSSLILSSSLTVPFNIVSPGQ